MSESALESRLVEQQLLGHELDTLLSATALSLSSALSDARIADWDRAGSLRRAGQALAAAQEVAGEMRLQFTHLDLRDDADPGWILQSHRGRAGRLERPRLEPVRVGDVVADCLQTLQSMLADRTVLVTGDVDVVIDADPLLLSIVVRNIVVNAARHTTPGTRISIDLGKHRDRASLTIEDEGPAVPVQFVPEMFDRGAGAGRHKGQGLGLYLVRVIVRAHGGEAVFAISRKGGSRLTLTFPLSAARAHSPVGVLT